MDGDDLKQPQPLDLHSECKLLAHLDEPLQKRLVPALLTVGLLGAQ